MNNISSTIEWERKTYDAYDQDVAIRLRTGRLIEGDVYKLDRYKAENLQSILLLPNSVIQVGFSWIRYIPTGESSVQLMNNRGLTKSQENADEMSIILINSVISAIRENSRYSQGQLINYLARGEMISKTPNKFNNNNASSNFNTSQAYNITSFNQSAISEILPINSGNDNENILMDLSINKSNRTPTQTPRKRVHYLDPDETYNVPQNAAWFNIEELKAPTGIPNDLLKIVEEYHWEEQDDKLKKVSNEFNEATVAIFKAMRTPIAKKYELTQLRKEDFDVTNEIIEILKNIFISDEEFKEKENKVKSNQAIWILANCMDNLQPSHRNRINRIYSSMLLSVQKVPNTLIERAKAVSTIWGDNVPISRMQSLDLSLFYLVKKFGENSPALFKKALTTLQQIFPTTI